MKHWAAVFAKPIYLRNEGFEKSEFTLIKNNGTNWV